MRRIPGGILSALLFASAAAAQDQDGDSVPDTADNCIEVFNPAQADGDGDGCGDFCDYDIDQTGSVGVSEVAIWRICWYAGTGGGATGGPPQDPQCEWSDLDDNGHLTGSDFAVLRQVVFSIPGPSAVSMDPVACP